MTQQPGGMGAGAARAAMAGDASAQHGAGLELITEAPERAMVIFAHPDDAEIGAGATVAKWARAGCEITYVQCTTGSSGSNDRSMTTAAIVPIRAAEQKAAADTIGVKSIEVLDHQDGWLDPDRVFLEELVRVIRRHRPDVVFAHDPERYSGFNHRDHRAVGITAKDAIYPYARDHLHFPDQITAEGLETWKVKHLFMWGTDQPDVIVDVTDSLEIKVEALFKHESQIGGLATNTDAATRLRTRAKDAAAGYEFEYAETFRRLTARR
ncbi:MAG: PIG-L family deacetylase [Chloroflexi bacterium]|nr:PIG-L family deacetylase [Chloroflexota bacterium]